MKLEMWSKQRCIDLVQNVYASPVIRTKGKNRFYIQRDGFIELVYVSQTKPSKYGRGKWNYEFFHTFSVDVVEEIVAKGCNFILLDYVEERKIEVQIKDLFWLFQHNSRIKGKRKEWSVDIVVKCIDGEFYFTSYEQTNNAKRSTQLM